MRKITVPFVTLALALCSLPAVAGGRSISTLNPLMVSWQPPATWTPGDSGATAFSRAGFSDTAFSDISTPLPFVAVTACRQYDSRNDSALPNNTPRAVTLSGTPCGIPAEAQGVAVNITVFGITGAGINGVFKAGNASPPTTAWINYPSTETQRGNAGVVSVDMNAVLYVQVNQGAGTVHFTVDVFGYYAPLTGTQAVAANPLQIALLRWYPANQSGATFGPVSGPAALAFDGANIWVANNLSNPGTVTKLRASDGTSLGTFTVAQGATGLAFDGANIWVTNYNCELVTKLRASDGTYLGTFSVGRNPLGIAFDGTNIWVANSGSNNVTKLAIDGDTLGTFRVGTYPVGVACDGVNVWVTNNSQGGLPGSVTKLRASDGANLGTFSVGNAPEGVAFDGANIWVTNSGGATKLRASDGANLGTFGVGTGPQGVAFDGANIWVTNPYANTVTKLRASDGAILGTFSVGRWPTAVAFDGANIWVANSGGNNVTKL